MIIALCLCLLLAIQCIRMSGNHHASHTVTAARSEPPLVRRKGSSRQSAHESAIAGSHHPPAVKTPSETHFSALRSAPATACWSGVPFGLSDAREVAKNRRTQTHVPTALDPLRRRQAKYSEQHQKQKQNSTVHNRSSRPRQQPPGLLDHILPTASGSPPERSFHDAWCHNPSHVAVTVALDAGPLSKGFPSGLSWDSTRLEAADFP